MDKISNNWTYHQVTTFLESKGFDFYEDLAHAQSWLKLRENGEPGWFVEIKFTKGFYTFKALMKIIRQSGVAEEEWVKWTKS